MKNEYAHTHSVRLVQDDEEEDVKRTRPAGKRRRKRVKQPAMQPAL